MRELPLEELGNVSGGETIVVTGTKPKDPWVISVSPGAIDFGPFFANDILDQMANFFGAGGGGGAVAEDNETKEDKELKSFDELSEEQKESYTEERENLRQEYLERIKMINKISSEQNNEPGSSYAYLGMLANAFAQYREAITELNEQYGIEEPVGITEGLGAEFTG